MTDFLKNTEMLIKSIISQRLLLISIDKSQKQDNETIRRKAEDLRNEMWSKQTNHTMAQFLISNFDFIESLIPANKQSCARKAKLMKAKIEAIRYYCPQRSAQVDLHDGNRIESCWATKKGCVNYL